MAGYAKRKTTWLDGIDSVAAADINAWELALYQLKHSAENIIDYGADPTGAIDSTSQIQSAVTGAGTNGAVFIPPGLYKISGPIIVTSPIRIFGYGPELKSKIFSTSALGSNAAFLIQPSSLQHHFEMSDIGIDLTSSPNAVGIFITNCDLYTFSNIKVRGGVVGLDVSTCQSGHYFRCFFFNQTTASMRFSGASSVAHRLFQCFIYQTTGATADCIAGIEIQGGNDFHIDGCTVQRAPGTNKKFQYGLYVHYATNTNGYIFATNSEFDAMTDLFVNGTTSAAAYLVNAVNARFTQCWFSASDSALSPSPKAPGVKIDGCDQISFLNCWISGTGAWFYHAPGRVDFVDCDFANAGGDGAFNFDATTSPPTALFQWGNRLAGGSLATVAAPGGVGVVTSGSGGTGLAANTTYYYVVTALNAAGETIGSLEVIATTGAGATNSNTVSWTQLTDPTVTGYRIYRGTTTLGQNTYYAVGLVGTFVDTGAAGTVGTPPLTNTAASNVPLSAAVPLTPFLSHPHAIMTSDASAKESFVLQNAKTGKKRSFRMDSSSTGTLQILNDANSVQYQMSDGGVFTSQTGVQPSGTANSIIRSGTNTPEGAITAGPGSIFLRTNGGAATSFYVKESGTGNTGWVAK